MKEEFVSYEIARKMKECGFDWEATGKYVDCPDDPILFSGMCHQPWNLMEDEIIAPSLSLAQKWLREVKGIAINVIAHDGGKWEYDIVFLPNAVETDGDLDRSPWCRTYEEALEEGIDTALKLLEV